MIRHPELETMPRKELEKLQLSRLQAKVKEVYEKVPFYRRAFKERGVTPDSIRKLSDLSKLPFTTKLDFRDNYPYGLMAVPLEQVVRIHSSSGTTGKPVVAPYTRGDIDMWSGVMARTLASAGTTKDDVLQNAYGYGLFTGGLGFHYGAELLGATVVPSAAGNTKRQLLLMQDLGTTVLTCTPSYALIIAEVAEEMGVDIRETKLRLGVHGAEPWSEQMRKDIEQRLGISAINVYGLTEVVGPGVSVECEHKCGMHVWEDHFLVEVIDPATGEQLPYGSQGELVITT
ncbi:MAG: phenylacetate--CoA ligase, partial [Chloroflexota bacterium]